MIRYIVKYTAILGFIAFLSCLAFVPAWRAYSAPEAPAAASDMGQNLVRARAVQAVIWGMPAVNYDLMLQEMLTKTSGKVNQVIYWGKPLDWHNQTLTPNPDTLYFMAFLNTKDVGPIVIDIPPADNSGSLNANIVNIWQMALEDGGLLGIDKGKGVKFLVLPPGYKGKIPQGYTPLRPETFGSYALMRSNLKSHDEEDVAKSVAYGRKVKIYPLSQAANPSSTVFTDVKDANFDSTIRYDRSFFVNLDRIIQSEPWFDRDRVMIDQLKTIGIEKGKLYQPKPEIENILDTAAREAHDILSATYDKGFPTFFEGTHWTYPTSPDLIKEIQTGFGNPDAYPVDERGLAYHYAFIAIKRLGAGQFYMISIKDKDGKNYDGSKTYRLNVPPNVPTDQYWSVTAYDRETHALIRNVDRASRASNNTQIQKNTDGSVDIYFGPKAPEGKDSNWVPTDPARGFELMFRLYGPKKEFFDKVWKLTDVEEVK